NSPPGISRFSSRRYVTNGGRTTRSTDRRCSLASTDSRRHDWINWKTTPDAHAWGEHATGESVGPGPPPRGKPQKEPGRRWVATDTLASKSGVKGAEIKSSKW